VEIRQATEDDLPAVVDLVERAYEPWIERIGRRPAPMDSDYAALIGAGEVHLLDDGGRAVGLVIVRDLGDHLVVDNVAVDPEHQGRGHGRALLAFAERRAAELGLTELRLYTNALMTENIALYRRLGWRDYDRHSERGFMRVYFRKQLAMPSA
jgi:ribosomal protein S18 acetylase RimI-like enzyme